MTLESVTTMHIARRTRFLLALLALVPAGAQAQPAPWQPERLTAGWTFTPGMALGTAWDSNITLQGTGAPKTSQWIGLFNPRGEIDFNGRRTRLNAGYSGALERYPGVSELNRYEQRARLSLTQQATPRLSISGNASYAAVPTTDRLDLGGGAIPFVNVGSTLFDATGGLRLALSPRTRLEGHYRVERVQFDRDEAGTSPFLLGGHSQSPGVRLMHDASRRLSVGGGWELRDATLAGGAQTFVVQNLTGELAYRLDADTTLSAGAGGSHLRVSNTDLTTWGPAFHAAIERHVGQMTVDARYERAFVPSFGFGGLTANQTFGANAHIPFQQGRLSVSGGIGYRRTSPVEALGVGFELSSLFTHASLGYQFARWLRAEGFLDTSHQTSTARGDVARGRIGIQFVTFKPVRMQ